MGEDNLGNSAQKKEGKKSISVVVDNKGRLSIPIETRKRLGINPGDVLFFRERNQVLQYVKGENPFDILAKQAIKDSRAGKTISLDDYEKKWKPFKRQK